MIKLKYLRRILFVHNHRIEVGFTLALYYYRVFLIFQQFGYKGSAVAARYGFKL